MKQYDSSAWQAAEKVEEKIEKMSRLIPKRSNCKSENFELATPSIGDILDFV